LTERYAHGASCRLFSHIYDGGDKLRHRHQPMPLCYAVTPGGRPCIAIGD
jgi:hypothetical protein